MLHQHSSGALASRREEQYSLAHAEGLCPSGGLEPAPWRGQGGDEAAASVSLTAFHTRQSRPGKPLSTPQCRKAQPAQSRAWYPERVLITGLRALPGAISLKLHFLNEATASSDSGESGFPTRALRLMQFSGLILKTKSSRTKKCATLSRMKSPIPVT